MPEAHGRGVALEFNYLTDEGGIKYDAGIRTFAVVPSHIKEAVRKLTHDLLRLEAEGAYDVAKAMLDKYVVRPEMQDALDRLKDVPVDIEPSYSFASARVGR